MHRVNAGYTLLARLHADRVEAARALLAELDARPERIPFSTMATTHFATITILPAQQWGDEPLPPTLLFATSYCGPVDEHVEELVRVLGGPLRELFVHCEGFAAGCDDAWLEQFIRKHRRSDTFYSGMQHLTPRDVRRHHELRTEIQTFVDDRQRAGGLTGTAREVRREIQDHIRKNSEFRWAQDPFTRPPGTWLALHGLTMIPTTIAAALVLCAIVQRYVHDPVLGAVVTYGGIAAGLFVLFLIALVGGVRFAESQQTYVTKRPPDPVVRSLAATQNRPVINEFTIAGPIKEGFARPLFLRMSLWVVARVAEGIPFIWSLRTGINIPTVATARWIASDRGRRLIFISNYTNAAEPYVRDFIDITNGARRINLVFGFGRGYPKTQWVIGGGALDDPNGFIHVVTEHQRPTAFWYGPYRDISIDNIKINRQIREGLFENTDEEQAQAWLHLL